MRITKYSFGIGDRFGCQGEAQLRAIVKANNQGVELSPVWNKSFREHSIISSSPNDVRKEADKAVKKLKWKGQYFVDADHIKINNVDPFIKPADFFTIDVADYIGKKVSDDEIDWFIDENTTYNGELNIPGISQSFHINKLELKRIASTFLSACNEASSIYNYIKKKKGTDNFITEVSMDEVEKPQSPIELFFILKGLSLYEVPVQTIAPKFTGRFNKGVDYVGDLKQFRREFEEDLLVLDFAIKEFGLPENLKLSVHSGSDKFIIYPIIKELIYRYNKGIHVKTAGTTWLEEIIGLSLAGGATLQMVKSIYARAFEIKKELCAPYANVIEINPSELVDPREFHLWSGEKIANTIRHIPGHVDYNPHIRQLMHVAYKIASSYGKEYINLLKANEEIIGEQVTQNIYERHLMRLFEI